MDKDDTNLWPDVAVCIPTYKRPQIVAKCVTALLLHLKYPGNVYYFVSEDGDSFGALDRAFDGMPSYFIRLFSGPSKGLGANLNHLLSLAEKDKFELLMMMDDDHILREDLDIKPHVKELLNPKDGQPLPGWIRLYWVQGHHYRADLFENYWYVDWNSPFLYVPSFRPHIKHKRFHDFFGSYPVGLKLGETEERWCHMCRDKAKKHDYGDHVPRVLVPLNHKDHMFDHVGESWQKKGL